MEKITLTILGQEREFEAGITYAEIAEQMQPEYKDRIVLAKMNNRIRELSKTADEEGELTFLTLADAEGMRTYRRSVMFMLYAAAKRIAGDRFLDIRLIHTIQQGYYCEITKECDFQMSEEILTALKEQMEELRKAELPIEKKNVKTSQARKIFAENGMKDKERLFYYRRVSRTNIYELDGYQDYFYGFMLTNTRELDLFELVPYEKGFMVLFPSRKETDRVAEFTGSPKLYRTLMEATSWGVSLNIPVVSRLNDAIAQGRLPDIMLVQEALMERNISETVERIRERGHVKFVMIAGPSSSGKTSFANRICIQLLAQGLKPHLISLDDFYLDRELLKPDENGQQDFEAVEALDVEAINNTLDALLRGETVSMPTFNFKKGKQEFHGNYLTLEEQDVLVIEGIHGLNDALSRNIPKEQKFKIYISALSQINIDENNCMSVTDGRLLRRMIRDARTRGTNAAETIERWPSVRAGEEKHIFPFQENADVMFNSALIYELPLIKVYAEPLLFGIPEDSPSYSEAKRLLKLLDYVLPYPAENLNKNSLAREFVGGSIFNV